MQNKYKTTIFWLLVTIFCFITPAVLFYSWGWKINLKTGQLTQSGILHIQTIPSAAQVYLNEVLKGKTDFFFGSLVFNNLLPGKYEILVDKEGYYPWKKELTIKEKIVTDARSIVLIPQNTTATLIHNSATKLFSEIDGRRIFAEAKKTVLNPKTGINEENYFLITLDCRDNLAQDIIAFELLAPGTIIEEIIPLSRPEELVIKTKTSNKLSYYLILPSQDPYLFSLKEKTGKEMEIDAVYKHPTNREKLITRSGGKLFSFDIPLKQWSLVEIENVMNCDSQNRSFYCLDDKGIVSIIDIDNHRKTPLNLIPIALGKDNHYSLKTTADTVILRENDTAYYLDRGKFLFKKIADNIKDIQISPDGSKAAFWNDNEISITYFQDTERDPLKKAGDQVALLKNTSEIKSLYWYTNSYLLFSDGRRIMVSEIDERNHINSVNLFSTENHHMIWSPACKKIYFSEEENIYSTEKLIP